MLRLSKLTRIILLAVAFFCTAVSVQASPQEFANNIPFLSDVCTNPATRTSDGNTISATNCTEAEIVEHTVPDQFVDSTGRVYETVCDGTSVPGSIAIPAIRCTIVPTERMTSVPPNTFTPAIPSSPERVPIILDDNRAGTAAAPSTPGGIVPACRVGDQECDNAYDPSNYGVCEVVELANNILRFIIGLVSVFAAIAFVFAGFKLVVSQGNPAQIQAAKSLFTNILVGLLLLLAAYTIVNTIMGVLVGGNATLTNLGQVNCKYSNAPGAARSDLPTQRIDTEGMSPENLNQPVTQAGGTIIFRDGSSMVLGGNTGDMMGVPYGGGAGACDPNAIGRIWGPQLTGAVQCIIRDESACGASPISRIDVSRVDGNPFSFGAMQINTTVHEVRGCGHLGIQDLRCLDAWTGVDYQARVTNLGLYRACQAALFNNECSLINGRRIYQEARNSFRPWTTAAGCRLR